MRIETLGESTLLVRDLPCPPYLYAQSLNDRCPAGLLEAVPSYTTVGLFIDPDIFSVDSLPRDTWDLEQGTFRTHQVPVVYDGEDLCDVATALDLSPDELIQLHSAPTYTCAAVGFRPGFAYLGPLDGKLAQLARRAVPRTHVPAGAVAMVGDQTAVYPQAGPGGWWLIGRCPLTLVDEAADYFPVAAGDRVRFVPISAEDYERRSGERL